MGRRILCLVCFTAVTFVNPSAMAWPNAEEAAKQRERLVAEATALYAKVLGKAQPTERCSLNGEWDNDPVPEYVARKHLGLKLHARLVAPYNNSEPAEVLDPAGKMQAAFCTTQEWREYEERLTKELTDKFTKENTPPDRTKNIRTHSRTIYSFPLFNETFDRAVIVQTWVGSTWAWRVPYPTEGDDNKRLVGSVGGSVHAYIWAKKDGVWQLIDSEEMAQFD